MAYVQQQQHVNRHKYPAFARSRQHHQSQVARCRLSLLAFTLLFLLCSEQSALAIQSHIAPEGFYVHLTAHLLYTLAMLGFLVGIVKSGLWQRPGWRAIAMGALLLASWNIWALSGHIIENNLSDSHFLSTSTGIKTYMLINSWQDTCYYLLKMDHLLCVPALVLLYLGLRRLNGSGTRIKKKKSGKGDATPSIAHLDH